MIDKVTKLLILSITAYFVSGERVLVGVTSPRTAFVSKSESTFSGGYLTCFYMNTVVDGVTLKLLLDTGSSNTVVAGASVNDYSGAHITQTNSVSALSATYGDGSSWQGFFRQLTVSIPGTNITASNSPIIVITKQNTATSSTPNFLGSISNGLMGLGYDALSTATTAPKTVLDAFVLSSKIRNKIGFFGCPYSKSTSSWIDFSAETGDPDNCGTPALIGKTISPSKSYLTLNVMAVYVNSASIALPASFQGPDSSQIGGSIKSWSILDSCTSLIYVTSGVATALKSAIMESGGLSSHFTTSESTSFLEGNSYSISGVFNLNVFPTLSFEIESSELVSNNTYGSFRLVLGPSQYIQKDDTGAYTFLVAAESEKRVTLGLAFFSAFYIEVNYDTGSISFTPGCSCTVDGYPRVLAGNSTVVAWDILQIPTTSCQWTLNMAVVPTLSIACIKSISTFMSSLTATADIATGNAYFAAYIGANSSRAAGTPSECTWPLTVTDACTAAFSGLNNDGLQIKPSIWALGIFILAVLLV